MRREKNEPISPPEPAVSSVKYEPLNRKRHRRCAGVPLPEWLSWSAVAPAVVATLDPDVVARFLLGIADLSARRGTW